MAMPDMNLGQHHTELAAASRLSEEPGSLLPATSGQRRGVAPTPPSPAERDFLSVEPPSDRMPSASIRVSVNLPSREASPLAPRQPPPRAAGGRSRGP